MRSISSPPIDVTLRTVAAAAAGAADAVCIGVLATQVFLETYATAGIRLSIAREVLQHLSTEAIAAMLSEPATTFIVAETGGHLVAFVQITEGAVHARVPAGHTMELNRLYVQERFAGQGIGGTLLRHAEALAIARGITTMWLTAWVHNHRALDFYAAKGYRDIGDSDYTFEGEHHENRVFVRELSGKP